MPKKRIKFTAENLTLIADPSVEAWLNEFSKEGVRNQYESRLMRFFIATNTSALEIKGMETKQLKSLLLTYQKDEVEKGQRQQRNFKRNYRGPFLSYLSRINR